MTKGPVHQVLYCPELLWCIFNHLDDGDLRPLTGIRHFAVLMCAPEFIETRKRTQIRALDRKLQSRRPSIRSLVHANIMLGSSMTMNAVHVGQYVLGPEHRLKVTASKLLSKYFIKRMLQAKLNRRIGCSELLKRNIMLGTPYSKFPVTHCLAARSLVAPRTRLAFASISSQLNLKLKARPSFKALVDRNLVPVNGVIAQQYYTTYLPLLLRQAHLTHLLRIIHLNHHFPHSHHASNWVCSFIDSFLASRKSVEQIALKKVLKDKDVASLVCPNIRDKLAFFENCISS